MLLDSSPVPSSGKIMRPPTSIFWHVSGAWWALSTVALCQQFSRPITVLYIQTSVH
ncbi:hypothetical protein MGG_16786 [Pyricularia oryzae 70-15]|uniref:Uncharacterized protein n=3 Tax=Pyricularia oryzae TaxID=318829 RepID=G4N0W6_PYRO7|nr:uncharacterized protein MGG_16786 [Pyricularia oryzae 70-15]EHA52344.1 hypothetical protein MGG_16786 [Pyricularia oryzae 70-15]ELQ32437.1 hypothetical protein OOU_Y34scaffold01162g5 [Pyricularia oryzae Y34]